MILPYNPDEIISAYERNARLEDESEKDRSLRVEMPREFIRKYLTSADYVLDAGGGTGINAIIMAELCRHVTLLDITPAILRIAEENLRHAGASEKIQLMRGDITNLADFESGRFSFVVCVGDALSYALERRGAALDELVRVARSGSHLVLGCDSKYGFLRMALGRGDLDEAFQIMTTSTTYCGMGPPTHLYTVEEMTALLNERDCRILEVAATPAISDTIALATYEENPERWEKLKRLEMALCTEPELLGIGLHLLFVARKQ